MSYFVVSFMKDVLGGNGRHIEICQRKLEVHAADEIAASELAKRKFCETERLGEWSLRADRIAISPASHA